MWVLVWDCIQGDLQPSRARDILNEIHPRPSDYTVLTIAGWMTQSTRILGVWIEISGGMKARDGGRG